MAATFEERSSLRQLAAGIPLFLLAVLVIWGLEVLFMRYAHRGWVALGLPTNAGSMAWYLCWLVLLLCVTFGLSRRSSYAWARWPAVRQRAMGVVSWVAPVVIVGFLYWNAIYAVVQRVSSTGMVATPGLLPFVSGAVMAPLIEEWLFRHTLYGMLAPEEVAASGSLRKQWMAILLTSAVFSAWHLPFNPHAPLVAHFVFGCAMGFVRAKSGSIVVPILLHAMGNAFTLIGSAA